MKKKLILFTVLIALTGALLSFPVFCSASQAAALSTDSYYWATEDLAVYFSAKDDSDQADPSHIAFYIPDTYYFKFTGKKDGTDYDQITYNGGVYFIKSSVLSEQKCKESADSSKVSEPYYVLPTFKLVNETVTIYDITLTKSSETSKANIVGQPKFVGITQRDSKTYFYITYTYEFAGHPLDLDGYIEPSATNYSALTLSDVTNIPANVELEKPSVTPPDQNPDDGDPNGGTSDSDDPVATNHLVRWILVGVICVLCIVIVVLVFKPYAPSGKNRDRRDS